MNSTHRLRIAFLAGAVAVAGSFGTVAHAQTADDAPEAAPVVAMPAASGPVTINWTFKRATGRANLTFNPDGTYLFSGTSSGQHPKKDIDVALALKASNGAIMVFHFVGDAAHGTQWSKQGRSVILKDNFALFSHGYHWSGSIRFHESAAARRAEYEARERKREELEKRAMEARERHDEKVEKEILAQLEGLRREVATKEREHHERQSSSGDDGSSVGSVIGTIGGVLGSVLSFL